MKLKEKILIGLLTIITFGTIWIYWSKKKTQPKNELSISKRIDVNLEKLINLLLGLENINSVSATHTKVKINLKNVENIQINEIKNLKGISGVVVSSNAITIIVGNSAQTIKEELENKIK